MKLIRYKYPQTLGNSAYDSFFGSAVPTFGRFGLLFDDFFGSAPEFDHAAADLYEDDQNYFVRLELAGVSKKDIDLELENSVLTIRNLEKDEAEDVKSCYSFQRSISIPEGVALDKIGARLEDGILTVVLPKEEARKPRQIEVN
ncbi:MAG: Hsp20/alpha crystallin family protein [Lentimonas sp.]